MKFIVEKGNEGVLKFEYINRYIRYVVTIKRYSIFRMVIIIQFTL